MSISYPFSNPIKQRSRPVETLIVEETYEDLRGQRVVQDVLPAKFLQTYFQECSHSSMDWSPTELGLIYTIRLFKHRPERGLYTDDAPLLHLLNSISRRIFESRDGDGYALMFRSADKRPIYNPFTMHSHTPEIVAIWERSEVFPQIDYTQDDLIPQTWCAFAAVGEVESSSNGKYQLGVYLKNLLQLHPELNAVLGLTAKYNGYSLLYHDASVIHRSSFDWGEPGPLFAFVEKLYTRPFQDTSMQLVAPQYRDMTWAIRIGDQVYLTEASRCLAGPGQRRYTTTAIDLATSERVFIKDIWRDARRVFFETLLFEKAHKGEPLPGLMLVDSHGYVLDETQNRLSTASHQISPGGERYKMRMMTKEVGRPLETIRSLRHFLCVMYDACAVQRNLYRKCQILHRDISTGNIMLAPTTDQYWERCKNGFAEVKFVNQVLEEDGKTSSPQPTCLLIDLGNGADLNATRDNNQLRQRTGTPKFIARSVSSGTLLNKEEHNETEVNLPSPNGIDNYLDRMHATEYQHNVITNTDSATQPNDIFMHRLSHDAESTFWVIVWTLIQSAGEGYQAEQNYSMSFRRFYHVMSTHFPIPGDSDPRSMVGQKALDYWTSLLHPDLQSMGPMLHKMFLYIRPEWAYRPELNPEHVHEALMRLLLAEIVKLDQADIPLDIGIRAAPPPPSNMPALLRSMQSISHSSSLPSLNSQSNNSFGASHDNTGPSKLPKKRYSGEAQVPQLGHGLQQLALEPKTGASMTFDQKKAHARSIVWQPGTGQLQYPGELVEPRNCWI